MKALAVFIIFCLGIFNILLFLHENFKNRKEFKYWSIPFI